MLCGRKKLPFAGYSVVKDRSGIPRGAAPTPQARVARSPELAILRLPGADGNIDDRLGGVGRAVGPRQTDMENTGLEPVTSWLQTRRSPS